MTIIRIRSFPVAVMMTMSLFSGIVWAEGSAVFVGLSAEEEAVLGRGEALIRQAVSNKSLSLAVKDPFGDEIRNRIRSLGANYVGEILMIIPSGKTSSTALVELAKDIADVEGYVGIPYYGKENSTWYDLFDRMRVVERTGATTGERIVADQHMKPFDDYRAAYSYELDSAGLRFRSENMSPIVYKSIKAVGPGGMLWFLYGFSHNGATCLYGVGAVRAFDLFGLLGDRLRISFMGRIEAFFTYLYAKRSRKG